MKPRFKPTTWEAMPLAAKKCYLRMAKAFPGACRLAGWEWFIPFFDRKMYAVNRDMQWFVAERLDG